MAECSSMKQWVHLKKKECSATEMNSLTQTATLVPQNVIIFCGTSIHLSPVGKCCCKMLFENIVVIKENEQAGIN